MYRNNSNSCWAMINAVRGEEHSRKMFTALIGMGSWLQSRLTHTLAWLWAPARPCDKCLCLDIVSVGGML